MLHYYQLLRQKLFFSFFFFLWKLFFQSYLWGDHYGNKVALTFSCHPCHFKLWVFLDYILTIRFLFYTHFVMHTLQGKYTKVIVLARLRRSDADFLARKMEDSLKKDSFAWKKKLAFFRTTHSLNHSFILFGFFFLKTTIDLCSTILIILTGVHLCSSVFTCVHLCSSVFTCVHLCSSVFICVHLCGVLH